ncbi:hypothetical protein DPMN_174361 [Dreissena polymorpha]|uniref:Uncharacterized protein n=1 Tax=Dreissena polymorpha TaxID=45954 RepID=A0A9D4III1_DREPO|nr:hypothetical protein DPMN_174361 [Dreissena polymorpha]
MSLLEQHTFFMMTTAAVVHVSRRKRKHRYWTRAIIRKRQTYGTYYHLVRELELNDKESRTYFRLSRHQFGNVLSVVEEQLNRRSTSRSRQSISAKERLALCLK